ncbi:GTP cyclohydrolase I FolE [bacterium]|nr:GTP cyclohydrolase I FolE [bacterium]
MKEYSPEEIKEMLSSADSLDIYRELIKRMGDDPAREGLVKTPLRIRDSREFLMSGYNMDAETILNGAIFEDPCDEMVLVRDISFYSMCEHHMLPFFGKIHVAYLPKGRSVGLSKIPRIIEMFARRLQIQERLTSQIAKCLMENLKPYGVGVVCEANHLCMAMRGVQKSDSFTTTSAMEGTFKTDGRTRHEFLKLISMPSLHR